MTTTQNNTTLTGHAALEFARRNDAPINKFADPTEGAREGLTVAEAEEVAREDASLLWLDLASESEVL